MVNSSHEIWRKLNQKKVYFATLAFLITIVLSSTVTYFITRPAKLYPLDFEANFIAACINTGDSAYGCVCPLRYFENHLSYKEAQVIDQQANKTGKLPRSLQQVFNDCRKHISS
jgi:hypothetical protein